MTRISRLRFTEGDYTIPPVKVIVTKDAKKLWSCRNMLTGDMLREPPNKGKLPPSSGEEFEIRIPGTKSEYCRGTKWVVLTSTKTNSDKRTLGTISVCSHQIDFLSRKDERVAKKKA